MNGPAAANIAKKHWTDNIVKKVCDHTQREVDVIKNFTYADTGEHLYCPICRCHWWKGRFWSAKEWDVYINDLE
jgi:hypothetical protein